MAEEAKRVNGYDKDKLKSYIARVEEIDATIASLTGEFMAEVKAHKEDIKELFLEAKNAGFPTKPLRAMLKLRKLDRDKEKVFAGMEDDDRDTLDAFDAAMGDFGDTPLASAARASKFGPDHPNPDFTGGATRNP